MILLGTALLVVALLAALYAGGAAIHGARTQDRRWLDSSRLAIYSLAVLLTLAVLILEAAFLRDDFSFKTVAEHSSTATPTFYKLTAMWSSQEGSLLLWCWVLSLASSAVLYLTRNRFREIVPWATAVLAGLAAFFAGLMLIDASPFVQLSPAPPEGAGLTPLLQNPYMVVHPPMLYSGYVFFSIPFAFSIGALITRRVDARWIQITRRFALMAWIFLGVGLILGSRWSYEELGWGGYWAWDPVENAALMPWLVGTAFLHSVMVQEKRGMLKVWNVTLISATFCLSLLGTFLVRSGVLQSIHAFGASTVGGPLLALLGVVAVGSTLLIISRRDDLRPERRISHLLSREGVFLINNLLLVGMAVVILWGTFFPLISELFTGNRASLAAPWFDRYVSPLAVLLVLFTGIGPLFAWGRVSVESARRILLWPAVIAAVTAVVLGLATDAGGRPWALALFSFAAFALFALGQEFWRGAAARRALTGEGAGLALAHAVARNRRRYGGYIVHAGIALLLIAVAASSSFQTKRDLRLGVGDSARVGDYTVHYVRQTRAVDPDQQRLSLGAVLTVSRDGRRIATLTPHRDYRPSGSNAASVTGFFEGEPTSEVSMRVRPGGDIWTAMQPDLSSLQPAITRSDRLLMLAARKGATPEQISIGSGRAISEIAGAYLAEAPPANFRVIVDPLVIWIWIGGLIAVGGALVAIWPSAEARRRVEAAYAARLGRELA